MKRLFSDKHETITTEGAELSLSIEKAIENEVKKYIKDGYSLRDIEAIVHISASVFFSSKILIRSVKTYKDKAMKKDTIE